MADRFEIEPINQRKLEGYDRFLLQIPESIIFDESLGDRRVTVLSYFLFHKSAIDEVGYSIDKMVRWVGKKPNKNKNKVNQKFLESIRMLEQKDIVKLEDEPSNSVCSSAVVNMNAIHDMCNGGRFAIIYFDELDKIIKYKNDNPMDRHMDNETVLMVFTCLRMLIPRRRNKLFSDEIGVDDRRSRSPDAYDCYYQDIADMLGLSERAVSKAVDALNELGLIYHETLPRTKSGDKWITNTTVFCNAYKREGGCLLESGENYYMREIENKKKKIFSFAKNGNKRY